MLFSFKTKRDGYDVALEFHYAPMQQATLSLYDYIWCSLSTTFYVQSP